MTRATIPGSPMRPLAAGAFTALTGLLGGTVACSDAPSVTAETGTFTVRDSAGISIVENASPAWGAEDGWRLSDEPILSIGVQEGAEEEQLFRVSGALRLPDGGIVVGNSGSREVRFYGPSGEHRLSVGAEGEGPGEYRQIRAIGRFLEDSIGVWDASAARVTVLGFDGGLGRTIRIIDADGGYAYFRGFTGDGGFVATIEQGIRPDTMSPGPAPMFMDYFRISGEAERTSLGAFFSSENYVELNSDGRISMRTRAFAPRGLWAAAPGLFVHTAGTARSIEVLRMDGTPVRSIRGSLPLVPVSPTLLEAFVVANTERIADPVEANRRRSELEGDDYPEQIPPYAELIFDSEGNLWAAEYDGRPWAQELQAIGAEAVHWTVFSPDGMELGVVRTPKDLTVHDIGPDYVLGLHRDELGVERVMLYGLIRP